MKTINLHSRLRLTLEIICVTFLLLNWTYDNRESLVDAVYSGDIEFIKSALKEGADVNTTNDQGESLLYLATINGKLAIVNFLVSKGANVNQENDFGESPVSIAAANGNIDMIKSFISKNGNKGKAMISAAGSGKKLIIEYLLIKGTNVNIQNDDGKTALMEAASAGYLEIVTYLLSKKAKVNIKDKNLWTALMWGSGNEEIVKLLVEKKADVNAKDNLGWNVLMMVVEAPDVSLDLVVYLVRHGANPFETSTHRVSAYDIAKKNERYDIIEFFDGYDLK